MVDSQFSHCFDIFSIEFVGHLWSVDLFHNYLNIRIDQMFNPNLRKVYVMQVVYYIPFCLFHRLI